MAASPVPGAGRPHDHAVRLSGVTRSFGELTAVDRVDLELRAGEVHAVLGENGAGKSTLMNVLAGFLAPDSGEIRVAGEKVQFRSPRDALAAGVGMVHQHFRLVEQFTVAENLGIGAGELGRLTDRAALIERARAIADRFGLRVDPEKPLWRLSVGEQQRVEILRTLARGASVLILDEPTAVLTPQESDSLCQTLREIAGEGATIVFISHKLREAITVADHISVMRKGKLISTLDRGDADVNHLARLMIGQHHDVDAVDRRTRGSGPEAEVVLEIEGATVRDERGLLVLDDLNLSVRAGEIVGIAGVAGNGQRELEEIATGLRKLEQGSVSISGEDLTGRPVRRFIDAGLAHIPEDRRGMGLVPLEPIWRNAILKCYRKPPVARGPLIRSGPAKEFARALAERVHLSTSDVMTPVQHLSGGNAQKLLAGREFGGDSRVVVAVNPTQGLDVGAAAAISQTLLDARDLRMGILLISADLDEVLRLSDRVVVLYEGRAVGETSAEAADRDRIGVLMGGGHP